MGSPLAVSMSGAGFLGVYHLGVAMCLRQHVGEGALRTARFAGASAGALVGAALAGDAPLEPCVDAFLHAAAHVRALPGGAFNPRAKLDGIIKDSYEKSFPRDAYKRLHGRLYVSITEIPTLRSRLVSDFLSNDDLLDALLCSSYIPGFTAAHPPTFRGSHYIDGGFSSNFPVIPGAERTIIVAPFAGRFDICPMPPGPTPTFSMYGYYPSLTNFMAAGRALYPPDDKELLRIHQTGYDHTLAFLRDKLGVKVSPTVNGTSFNLDRSSQ